MATSITDWNDLDAVRNNPSDDYVLENDLTSSTAGFSGIGDSWDSVNIEGTFDGNGYTIQDWTTTVSSSGGFFQSIDGTVKFLRLARGTMKGEDAFFSAGGFAAQVGSGGVVKNCGLEQFFDVKNDARLDIAGFVGQNQGTIQDCYAQPQLEKNGDDGDLCGFVTDNGSGTIERCFAAPNTYTQNTFGGKYGFVRDSNTETDCYWCTNCTGAPSSTGGSATGLPQSDMQGSAAKTNMVGFDFQNTWQEEFADYPSLRDPAPPVVTVDLSATGNATGNSEPTQVVVPRSFAATASASGTAQAAAFRRRRLFGATADAAGVSASPVLSRRRSVGATATASATGDALLDVQNPYTDLSATGSASGTSDATIERTRGFTASGAGAASADATVGRRRGLDATGSGAATADASVSRVRPLSASGSGSGDSTALFVLVRDGRGVVSPRRNRVIRVTPRQYAELLSSRVNTALDTDTIETGGN